MVESLCYEVSQSPQQTNSCQTYIQISLLCTISSSNVYAPVILTSLPPSQKYEVICWHLWQLSINGFNKKHSNKTEIGSYTWRQSSGRVGSPSLIITRRLWKNKQGISDKASVCDGVRSYTSVNLYRIHRQSPFTNLEPKGRHILLWCICNRP